jgi:chemotaxis protein MotB
MSDDVDPKAWMYTFSDLLFLMLTFFVLLLSMSSMDEKEFQMVIKSGLYTKGASYMVDDSVVVDPVVAERKAKNQPKRRTDDSPSPAEMRRRIETILIKHVADERGWLKRNKLGLVINFSDEVLFEEKSAQLKAQSETLIQELAELMRTHSSSLLIEAYVERLEGLDEREAAWELALRRSDTIATILHKNKIAGKRIRIMGYDRSHAEKSGQRMRYDGQLNITILSGDEEAEFPID